MENTSAVIIIAELLMFLSSGSGQTNPSLAPSPRHVYLLLHTGPLVSTPQCYSGAAKEPLHVVQLTPCDYFVIGVQEEENWCEDSRGVHSSNHYWRKKRSALPEWLVGSVTDLLNVTLIDPTNRFERSVEGFSNGQKQILGEVKKDGARVCQCGALNLTGNTMRLTECNACPAQREKDEHGVERDWPAINVGSTYNYSSNDGCVQAARTCSINQTRGPHLTPPDRFSPCPITYENLTGAVDDLRNISQRANISTADIEAAGGIVDRALQVNVVALSTSREVVSSIVHELNHILTRVRLSRGASVMNVRANVALFVLNVEEKPPLAVALESNRGSEDLEGSILRSINSLEEVQSPKVDVAVLLPESLMSSTSHVALAIFSNESAFQDPRYKVNSRILSLNMVDAPELQGGQYVDIVFRPRTEKDGKTCVFWDFNLNGGAWSAEGCELMASVRNIYNVCRCSHLTHFAQIILPPGSKIDPEHEYLLTIISISGCSLSILGLLAIFTTGAVFRRWRAQLGNKILLHLSTAVFINMLVFLIKTTKLLDEGVPCIIVGVILHYSVLASFCWMLVSALLQLKRLVFIFVAQDIPRLLLKASLFAWGVPLLPVAVLLAVDVKNYTTKDFCFPKGLGFYLAVMCPVLMIVTANLLVFGMILHNVISRSAIKSHRQTGRKLVMQRIATSVLLFFLLGLSWVFGLVAHLNIVFAYFFCITATLQGFVLFVFFVLGKKESRSYWVKSSTEQNFTTSTASTPAERAPLRRRDEHTVL